MEEIAADVVVAIWTYFNLHYNLYTMKWISIVSKGQDISQNCEILELIVRATDVMAGF